MKRKPYDARTLKAVLRLHHGELKEWIRMQNKFPLLDFDGQKYAVRCCIQDVKVLLEKSK